MPSEPIKVTISDPTTGEVLGEQIVDNDYVLICAGHRFLHSTQAYANGTHVLTVKDDRAPLKATEALIERALATPSSPPPEGDGA